MPLPSSGPGVSCVVAEALSASLRNPTDKAVLLTLAVLADEDGLVRGCGTRALVRHTSLTSVQVSSALCRLVLDQRISVASAGATDDDVIWRLFATNVQLAA